MKQERFTSPQGRHIIIKSTDDFILFYHQDNMERQEAWYQSRLEDGDSEVTEKDREVDEFYGIPKKEWHIPQRNWRSHMLAKTWFTDNMLRFIEDNI